MNCLMPRPPLSLTEPIFVQVLEGVADAYVFATPGCKKWDTCGPEALIRAAGGEFTDATGVDIDYSEVRKQYHMNHKVCG